MPISHFIASLDTTRITDYPNVPSLLCYVAPLLNAQKSVPTEIESHDDSRTNPFLRSVRSSGLSPRPAAIHGFATWVLRKSLPRSKQFPSDFRSGRHVQWPCHPPTSFTPTGRMGNRPAGGDGLAGPIRSPTGRYGIRDLLDVQDLCSVTRHTA